MSIEKISASASDSANKFANISEAVKSTIEIYLARCDKQAIEPHHLYRLVMDEVMETLFTVLMEKAKYNQCKVMRWLDISRTTVRKYLHRYNLIT